MACKLCKERGKTWEGDDPKCAFENKTFDTDNWNCATMNKLRDIAEEQSELYWRDDAGPASFGAIPFKGDNWQGYIVMTWYKSRGRTGRALLMCDDEEPQILTEEMALEAINYWGKRSNGVFRSY